MAMYGNYGFVNVGHSVAQSFDYIAKLAGYGVTYSIGNVDSGSASLNACFHYPAQVVNMGAASVFAGKFHVTGVAPRPFDAADRPGQHVIESHIEFILHMQGRSRQKYMNAKVFAYLQSLGRHINVIVNAARQTTNAAVFDLAGQSLYGFKISRGRYGETGFNDIHAQAFQGKTYLQFFSNSQAGLQSLFAIAQCRVENYYQLTHFFSSL
jgi:hypothetical protein